MKTTLFVAAGALLFCACAGTAVQITNTPIPNEAGAGKVANYDVVEIDQAAHRLYVADRTNQGVDVFDVSAPRAKFLTTIGLSGSPNGLAIAPDLARLFVGAGNGSVFVIDINNDSDSVVAEVKTGKGEVDLLDYAAARQRLYAANGADGSITSIDPTTNAVMANFKVGSALEQPRYNDADGMVYVTSPAADALFKIDPNDGSFKSFPLNGCKPTGLAINPKTNKAVIVCSTYVMTWDMNTGKSTASFKQVVGGDVAIYNTKADRFIVASPHLTRANVVATFGGDPIAYMASVDTGAHGNAVAFDETNGIVYTPNPQKPGLASFKLPVAPLAPPRWLSPVMTFGPILAVGLLFVLLFVFVGRSADPVRRPQPAPKPASTAPESQPKSA